MLEDTIGQLKAELAADKKKAAILSILLLVGVFMLLKLVLNGNKGPDAASGSIVVTSSEANGTISARPQAAQRDISEYLSQQKTELTRNIFAADFNQYPVGQIVHSDDEKIEDVIEMNLGEGLVLQSTLDLAKPTAIINGRFLTIGDRIRDCEVVKVAAGFCILRSGDTEFTLEMKSSQTTGR